MAEARGSVPPEALDPATALPHTLSLLRTKDDTSRFVGLALLKSLLDNQSTLRDDASAVTDCWTAISPSFLDRLLRATESKGKKSKDEAQRMVDLAVAVIHRFTVLLPEEAKGGKKLVERAKGLVAALLNWYYKLCTIF